MLLHLLAAGFGTKQHIACLVQWPQTAEADMRQPA
jgi:hypothetical protein